MGTGYVADETTVAHWPFDDDEQSPVVDDAMGASPMLIENTPARVQGPFGGNSGARRLVGGTGQHFVAAGGDAADAFVAGEWRGGGWLRLNTALSGSTSDNYGIALFGRLQAWWFRVVLRGDGFLYADWDGALFYANTSPFSPATCVLQPNIWRHLGFVKRQVSSSPNKYAVQIYVNGVAVAMGGTASAVNPTPDDAMASYLRLGTLGPKISTVPADFSGWWIAAGTTANFLSIYNAGVSATQYVSALGPSVQVVSPAPSSQIRASTPLVLDVTDFRLRRALVRVTFPAADLDELAFDGTAFTPRYRAASTAGSITNGLRLTLVREGGWPSSPRATAYAYDASGNEAA